MKIFPCPFLSEGRRAAHSLVAPLTVTALALSAVAFSAHPAPASPSFTPLGFLSGGSGPSLAHGMSADGSIVVGMSNSTPGLQAFLWSPGGMVGLGDIPGGFFYSAAFAASADGSVIVGASDDGSAGEEGAAFRWTRQQGMVPLGSLGGPTTYGQAQAVSQNGSIIVGASQAPSGIFAFRWTQDTGMVSLGDFPGGPALSRATGISGDGSVIVGTGSVSFTYDQAFRWTAQTGMVAIGSSNTALAVSADGKVIVGRDLQGAYRWSEDRGIEHLGRINGGAGLYQAEAVSADGSRIVGLADYDGKLGTGEAFIWDETHGMRDLNVVLSQEFGLSLDGFFLLDARAISTDGLVIAGYGFKDGEQEAWVADLRTSPSSVSPVPAGAPVVECVPNPFLESTALHFNLSTPEAVSVRVYSPSGRIVRVLRDGGVLAQGAHAIAWDGRDESGRRAAAGTYFLRLDTGGASEVRRVEVVR